MKKIKRKAELYSSDLIDQFINEITPEEYERTKNKMLLAAKIDNALKAKGWKKKDLAESLNKRSSEITKWLSGTHNFTANTLWDIEKVLGIELISLSEKKTEKVINYYFSATQKIDKEYSNSKVMHDYDELIPLLSNKIEV